MSMFQVQIKANDQTVNTDLEADNKDDVINFYRALSVAEIMQVKKYVYLNPIDFQKRTRKDGKYASVTITFSNGKVFKIKIPDLKPNIDQSEVMAHLKSLYSNVAKIHVNITVRA